jgi:deoxyribose-phosphate aldolase
MSHQILSKLEVNILNSKAKPDFVSNFVLKNRIPAIVASPEFVAPLAAQRAVRRGSYKIICALDFPAGGNFAMDKIWRANPDLVEADGFDILVSVGRSEIETGNEMKAIYEFLKQNKPMVEIRWCLRMNGLPDEAVKALQHVRKYSPTFIRTDQHLDLQNLDAEKHKANIELIKKHAPFPIKVSGNVDLETIKALQDVTQVKRFDVSFEQAETIARESSDVVRPTALPKQNDKPAVKNSGTPRIRI